MASITIDAAYLPTWYERGAVASSYFDVTVHRNNGGYVLTNLNSEFMFHSYDIGFGMNDRDSVLALKKFHASRRGQAYGFLFKDYADFESFGIETIGTGNGSTQDFQLIHTYDLADSDPNPFVRTIKRPISGTIDVYKDNTLQVSGYTVSTTTGIVHFTSAPANGVLIRASYEFYVPVMFGSNDLDIVLEQIEAGEVPNVTLVEVPE